MACGTTTSVASIGSGLFSCPPMRAALPCRPASGRSRCGRLRRLHPPHKTVMWATAARQVGSGVSRPRRPDVRPVPFGREVAVTGTAAVLEALDTWSRSHGASERLEGHLQEPASRKPNRHPAHPSVQTTGCGCGRGTRRHSLRGVAGTVRLDEAAPVSGQRRVSRTAGDGCRAEASAVRGPTSSSATPAGTPRGRSGWLGSCSRPGTPSSRTCGTGRRVSRPGAGAKVWV